MSAFELALVLIMLLGLIGVVIPFLPGLILIAGAGLVWAADGGGARWVVFAAMTVIGVAGAVTGSLVPARRASMAGAPGWVLGAGAAGMVIGFFVIPVVGALVGFPAGVYLGELARLHDHRAAVRTTAATLRGIGLGIAIQLAAGVAMVAVWAAAVLFN